MNRRLLALSLVLCLLLSGCHIFSQDAPDDSDPVGPNNTPDQVDQPDQTGPQPSTIQPLALPSADGIDWNDAPATSVGTGNPAPEETSPPLYTYSAYDYYTYESLTESTEPDERGVVLSVNTVVITGLRNQILQNRLNELIEADVQELIEAEPTVDPTTLAVTGDAVSCCIDRLVYVNLTIAGRVLSISVYGHDSVRLLDAEGLTVDWGQSSSTVKYYLFDMYDGRQLQLSDLFFEGADYVSILDASLTRQLTASADNIPLKRPFRGLPENYPCISAEGVYLNIIFPEENPYVDAGYSMFFAISPDELYTVCSILYEDPSAYLTDDVTVDRSAISYSLPTAPHSLDDVAAGSPNNTERFSPRLTGGVPQDVQDSINAALDAFEERYKTLDYLPAAMTDRWDEWTDHDVSVSFSVLSGLFSVSYWTAATTTDDFAAYEEFLTFDLRDGRRLTAADLLVPSDELTAFLQQNGITQPLEELDCVSVSFGFNVLIPTTDLSGNPLYVPSEYFNFALLESEVPQ